MTIALEAVIARVESGGNKWATRFEDSVYQRLNLTDDQDPGAIGQMLRRLETLHDNCSPNTARMIASTSWGLYQIMGENLSVNAYRMLAQPTTQLAQLNLLRQIRALSTAQVRDASWLLGGGSAPLELARSYNGPGDPQAYLAKLTEAYRALSA